MGKGRKGRKTGSTKPKRGATDYKDVAASMDDEIDAFHRQRDVVPLDINDDMEGSDDDDEHPVFDLKDANEEEEDSEDEDEDEDIEDDAKLTGLAAKIARQQKYLRAKVGGVEDEMHDDGEDEEEKRAVWGRRKNIYYSADNVDYELQSSDEELAAEEEAEVIRLQKEKAKSLSLEDFGIEDFSQDESDGEPTLEEIMVKGQSTSKAMSNNLTQDESDVAYVEVKKDLNALSMEEKMDVVYSSAPELVGLLSELNDALEELENKVNPLISKLRGGGDQVKKIMNYMEVKQLLLLSYCQAISFYLLLKAEGHSSRDHPVIAHILEVKNLLEKMKQLDANVPNNVEDLLSRKYQIETVMKLPSEDAKLMSDSFTNDQAVPVETQKETKLHATAHVVKEDPSKDNENKGVKHKRLNDQVGLQSREMLKVRAALEEKLKQKGIINFIEPKQDRPQKRKRPVNGQLETLDDFDDDTTVLGGGSHGKSKGNATSSNSAKLSQLVTQLHKPKSKVISGDDDLPKRDDIGERRRKHELRVLARTGMNFMDDIGGEPVNLDSEGDTDMEEGGGVESEDEFYKQIREQRAAKIAAKAEKYSRTPAVLSVPEEEALSDGRRKITYEMEKNRGLTRKRKKLTKNPRKKYKLKHQKAIVRRKGQVREIRKPTGPYGGEASGINPGISRSVRF